METPKKFLMFQETELFYISGSNFQSSKSKENPLLKLELSKVYTDELILLKAAVKLLMYLAFYFKQ